MAKTRQEKQQEVENLAEKLGRMKTMVFVHYEGLTVPQIEALRRDLKKEGASYTVAKKSLLNLALQKTGLSIDLQTVAGNFATVIGREDETVPARVLAAFAKNNEALKIAAGVLGGRLIEARIVSDLARLPSRIELLGQLVGVIRSPLAGLINVLAGNLRNFIQVLEAIRKTKYV